MASEVSISAASVSSVAVMTQWHLALRGHALWPSTWTAAGSLPEPRFVADMKPCPTSLRSGADTQRRQTSPVASARRVPTDTTAQNTSSSRKSASAAPSSQPMCQPRASATVLAV